MQSIQKHSIFSASMLGALEQCPGYVPSGFSGDDAQRGTRIALTLQRLLAGDTDTPVLEGDAEAVMFGLGEFVACDELLGGAGVTLVEYHVTTSIPGVEGTLDWAMISHDGKDLIVADNKSCWGSRNSAELQLQVYAWGLLLEPRFAAVERVRLYIVELDRQTRILVGDHEAGILRATVPARVHRTIRAAAGAPQPSTWKSCDACKFCLRNVTCPRITDVLESFGRIVHLGKGTAESLTGPDVGAVLDRWRGPVKTAVGILESVEARAKQLLKQDPESVPNWNLTGGRRQQRWSEGADDVARNLLGADELHSAMTLKSPASLAANLPNLYSKLSGLVVTTKTEGSLRRGNNP